jgi:hypothetical protein
MATAVAGMWQFPNGNYCGISNIQVISIYDYLKYNGQYPPYVSQASIHNALNQSNAVSEWGTGRNGTGRQHGPGPDVLADIAADGGTDPRAIAFGAYVNTPGGYYFHNWIYRTDATNATYDFASDFGPAYGVNDPISVTINGGAHSFVIDGVWAKSDPSNPSPGEVIYYIDTYDPWVSSDGYGEDYQQNPPTGTHPYNPTQHYARSLSDWISLSKFWGQGYNPYNTFDPEPNTPNGNYYNSPPLSAHWGGYYVTIEQDHINVGPDIAYDQTGNPAPHN